MLRPSQKEMRNKYYYMSLIALFVAVCDFFIVFNMWVNFLFPEFYKEYFVRLRIYEIFSPTGIEVFIFFSSILFIILHATHILKIKRTIFWTLIFIFLFNILVIILEVLKQGDS